MPLRGRIGYEWPLRITSQEIVEVHDEVARFGQTWDPGVREPGSLAYLEDRIRDMARDRREPEEIAAFAMVFIVREHPFWDGNHRTGFQVAELLLEAFGFRLEAPGDEIESYLRGIDARGLGEAEILDWIRRRRGELG